ncbi:hypothetical protein ACEWY4_024450 [Coilia grayii]|uniref:THAP-type domain-containing protein n=1 Tax=Coilia grayii TaxID=363190 RepID=A0ABD1J0E7_9TELE
MNHVMKFKSRRDRKGRRDQRKRKSAIFVRSSFVMPRHCSAAGCKSRDTRESRKAGITFHRLPKRENPRRALWIINSRRTGPQGQGPWDPQSDFIYFCSKHFTAESFELSGVSGYRRLKDDALPTVFEASSQKGRAGKRATRGRGKQRDTGRPARTKATPLKKSSDRLGGQQTAADNDSGTGKEASCTSESTNGKAHGSQEWADTGAAPQASSDISVVPMQAHQSACDTELDHPQPPSSPRPPSPSRYMRRLPPPPGFYLPREHSYAQLCPLVWRKQYDRAIDNLEKALRLLSAARRRENRLRHALMRLQESRLKSTLFRLRDGGGRVKEGRGGRGKPSTWSTQPGGGGGSEPARPERGNSFESVENSEPEGAAEDLDAMGEDTGGWRGQGRIRGVGEEEDSCCFYCGRGRDEEGPKDRVQRTAQGDGRGAKREAEGRRRRWVAKRRRGRKPGETKGDGGDSPKECYFYYCQTSETEEDMQLVTLELPHPQGDKARDASINCHGNPLHPLPVMHQQTQTCVQMRSVAGPTFPSSTLQDSSSTSFQLIQSGSSFPQGLLLADVVPGEGQQESNQQQVYWVQETTEGSLLLLSVPSAEDRGSVTVRGLSEDVKTETIFVSDVGFQSNLVEDREGLRTEGEAICLRATGPSERQGNLQTNIRGAVLSGDIKEKLKEHLEGFQLQLSNEFID